jgi:hypothetical protein
MLTTRPPNPLCYRLSQPQGHSADGRIMSMKNSNDTIGNRTSDLLTRSEVHPPTVLPCRPLHTEYITLIYKRQSHVSDYQHCI